MGIDVTQLENVIIRPSLAAIGLLSDDAVQLMLLTAANESNLGEFLLQKGIGFGGGIGIYQMQSMTYNMLWDQVISGNSALRAKIRLFLGYEGKPVAQRLVSDLNLASILTRLFYFNIKDPLPKANNIPAMAFYYKRWYNTLLGKATVEEAEANYRRLCLRSS